ncbi:hypothetical protein K227x_10190 [Rubripirellula lacrimiformis]|uniref:DUF7939 domain-containing protein n=1 Tax=Rubripirellula lacrimiformis TaxID=1930273 RepID=A0A517N696_9BACT|nr:BatD family protein [Rubripirellula lacrimiformis]QDT02641.1 hypothetical protein K227x_10190 [Rubripirellula lacrimiformis]
MNTPRTQIHRIASRSRTILILTALTTGLVTGTPIGVATAADVDRVVVDAPETEAWVGQRIPFFVKLRGKGPFANSASFSIPRIPRALLIKIGSPVVSSEDIGDESWFVQTHQFALFAQADGKVSIPSFEVRFTNRDGFTGPEVDHVEQTPATEFNIKRPPGHDESVFLVTTAKMTVTESWDPQPNRSSADLPKPPPVHPGDVFHRTITQTADQISGMAFAPASKSASEGIRVYTDPPVVDDQTERGLFTGTRRDTITYMIQDSGTLSIPKMKFIWWNPTTEEFGSQTLPAVTLEVTPTTPVSNPDQPAQRTVHWSYGWIIAVGIAALAGWQFRRIESFLRAFWKRCNPPSRVTARNLVGACKRNDAAAAEVAWMAWQNTQPPHFRAPKDLANAVASLHQSIYGSANKAAYWKGDALRQAFRQQVDATAKSSADTHDTLPPLNPIDAQPVRRQRISV